MEWQAAALRQAQECYGQGSFGGNQQVATPRTGARQATSAALSLTAKEVHVVAGAQVHDTKLLAMTLESLVERPTDGDVGVQHLCRDKGADNPTGHQSVAAYGYQGHIRRKGEEKLDAKGVKRYPVRRWVVECTLAWLSKCRAIMVRNERRCPTAQA